MHLRVQSPLNSTHAHLSDMGTPALRRRTSSKSLPRPSFIGHFPMYATLAIATCKED